VFGDQSKEASVFKKLQRIFGKDVIISELEESIDSQKTEVALWQKKCVLLEQELNILKDERFDSFNNDQASIDFSKLRVVSIERTLDERSVPHTVLGYLLSDDSYQLSEWYLKISEEAHNKLVEEFNMMKSYYKDNLDNEHC
jgi:hypothetical protein